MRAERQGLRHAPVLWALVWVLLPLAWYLPAWLPLLGMAALLGRMALSRRGDALPARWLLLPALALFVGAAWLQLGTLIGREGGVALLLLLTAFKAYETASLRDWRVLLALGFFLAAMPLLFDQSPWMAAWLVASMLLLTWAAAVLAGGLPRGSWRNAAQALLLSLPIMLVLFVLMPRLPEPLWSMPMQQSAAGSGLGEDMEPGSISRLILNRDPAFSVVFDGPAPKQDQMYWRTMLLDVFDGRRWHRAGEGRALAMPVAGAASVRYSLTLRADRGRLPALEMPMDAPSGSHFAVGGVLRQDRRQGELARYAMTSLLGAGAREDLSDGARAFYTRLPPGNPKSRALAAQLAARAGSEAGFAQEVLRHLRLGGFRYTLQPPLLGEQPEDQFLFETRQGFCEHYASAFVFLARAAGIPARVVVGYQGGEYNPVGKFWLVRSSDAHAWAEIWQAKARRWLRVDPTAAVSPGRLEQGAEQALPALRNEGAAGAVLPPRWLRYWRQQWLAADFAWQQWVVGYDANRQRGLFQRLGLGDGVDASSVLRGLFIGMTLAMLPLLAWWRRRPGLPPLAAGWAGLRQGLARRGIVVPASHGPLDMLKAAQGLPREDFLSLRVLLDEYIELRYRRSEADPAREKKWSRRARRWK
ncbi:transglutaminase family protein [Chromobacterium paludis]|uniref:transglutaminase family protein n=1 Tax=Chromobacterium paludis TaxID=2605945 RepID=UPI00143DB32C|nr:DUF3488 and transglutaminase-like domain-containing protein [Chromobacterium paludis]